MTNTFRIAALAAVILGFVSLRCGGAEDQDRDTSPLAKSLTLHASFDQGLNADFAVGDKACYDMRKNDGSPAAATDDVVIAPQGGRFGGGLEFKRKNPFSPAFKNDGNLNYNEKNWSATVSIWLRLDPDKDLEPGYCDPVQVVGDDGGKGFIFLEWSKDERPRYFRYAIRPLFEIWNPTGAAWDQIPFDKRPMVQVERAPFSHDYWTHVVFTLENVNDKSKVQRGRLYLNGEPQGQIKDWDLTLGWDPARVMLVLGASYVGRMDDLAVYNRALDESEVKTLYKLTAGAAELH